MPLSPEAARQAAREAKREANKRAHAEETTRRKIAAAARREQERGAALAQRELVKKNGARPDVAYSEELAALIARRVAAGENLLAICSEKGMPARATLFSWAADHPNFAEQMDRAIAINRQTLRERMSAIASAEIGFSTGDTSRDRLQIEDIERQLAAEPMYFGKGPAPDDEAEPVSYSDLKLLLFEIAEGDPSLIMSLERHIGRRPTALPLNDPLTSRVPLRESLEHARDVVATQRSGEDAREPDDFDGHLPRRLHFRPSNEEMGIGGALPQVVRHKPR